MKIKELYIENFGKLSKFQASFCDGLNSFAEDNGYGKTTLSVFIKAMLYGFDDTRRQSLDENERKKYTPWQGGAFGGYLVFETKGTIYRVERTFSQKAAEDTFKLYNLNTGKESNDFSASLGEELFGIDADGFERTVFLSEKNLSGKNTNQTISAKLSDLVGTEGDIGGFDDAIKLLDERRKFYQKRGGAGEIQDIETEIGELEYKINSLHEKRLNSAKTESDIATLNTKISALRSKKEVILKKERQEMLEREKRSYELQYKEMLGALKIDEARESELLEFFKNKIPSNAEIALAAEEASEITRLERKLSEMGENTELSSLKQFFKNPTSADECDKMKSSAKRIAQSRATMFSHSEDFAAASPFKKAPAMSQIEDHIAKVSSDSKKVRKANLSIVTIGILLVIAGIIIGFSVSSIMFSLSLVGVLLTLIGIIPVFSQKSTISKNQEFKNTRDFIFEVYGEERSFSSETEALLTMKNELLAYNEKSQTNDLIKQEREAFLQSVHMLEREVREFCEKYPYADGLTLEEKTEIIAYKHRRYEMLLEFEAEKESEKSNCRESIRSHRERLNSFITLFDVKSNDPISEIRRNLAEYEVIKGTLSRRRGDAERFAASHGIDLIPQNTPYASQTAENDFSNDLAALEEELLSLEREKSRTESEYAVLVREISSIEELEERLLEKREKIEVFRKNLNIITKTKDMLAKSRDSMTAKYLNSTKRGFEKYLTLIDRTVGDFTIDTSFTFMKTELGKSRQPEAYSRGTRDMHSLAMRLALVDALYGEEAPPIILDDPFIAFDDAHVESASAVLKRLAKERQIFYFTCSKSRKVR